MKYFHRIPPFALVCVAIALSGCQKKPDERSFHATTTVKMGSIVQVVTATGQLSAVVSVDVGSQISGTIQSLHVDFNSPVKKGQVVAEIDPVLYQAAANQAKGELASAQASLDLKELTSKRQSGLVARNAGTQADLDTALAELRQAEAAVLIKQAMLDRANADLEHCRIVAPVDGLVINRKVDVGQTVAATMTTPVFFTVAQDITKMNIIANVSEADIGQVAVGQAVQFTVDAFPDEIFQGTVFQVRKAPTTTENVVTYDTVVSVENPGQKLFPGMTAEVSILVAERRDVLTLSNAALRYIPPVGTRFEGKSEQAPMLGRSQRLVYLPGTGGAVKAAVVKIGATNGTESEVLEGLNKGDAVITASLPGGKPGGFGGPPPGGGPP